MPETGDCAVARPETSRIAKRYLRMDGPLENELLEIFLIVAGG
jgi:hypothetical protein